MNPYRLPSTVIPHRYDLRLEPDLGAATFVGTCATEIEVVEATDEIVCNAIELTVDAAWVELADGTRVEATAIELDAETERLTVRLAAEVAPGPAVVHTAFTGILNDKLHGFYRSTFTDSDGVEQIIATTQMEATDARRAFPCWDEPERKAVFAVTLVVADGLAALSNAREISRTTLDDGRVEVRFADTMVMSTYLVAFIVGPLDVTEPVLVDNKELRVAYPRGKGHLTPFALDVGRFCLEFFRDYYGIVYPGDKLDLVAVPDFAFGAMENLGCVTFREALLLVDPAETTQPELQRVTDVIAHELAHMWFGDLVTMKWWNGIWLNEAFATFMEMLATDAYRPDWDRWVSFGLSRTAAFDVDALGTTRPIEFEVVSPADAEGMFDILTYEKGAAVVRMLEQYLGAEPFRDGIRHYLSRHQYANTETTDLWDAIERGHRGARAPHHGQLDLPGRVPGRRGDAGAQRPDRPRERRVAAHAAPLRLPGRGGHRPPVGGAAADHDGRATRAARRAGRRTREGAARRRRAAHPAARAARLGAGQHRVDRLLPGRLRARAARGAPRARPGRAVGHRALRPRRRRLGARHRRPPPHRRVPRPGRRARRRGRPQRVGAHPRRARVLRSPRGRRRPLGVPGPGPRPRRPGARPPRHRAARRRLRPRPRVARPCSRRWPCSAPIPTPAPPPAPCTGVVAGEAVDPSLAAAAVAVIAATGDAADFDDFIARFSSAPTPQVELRYLYALAAFEDPALQDRLLDMCLAGEVRTQNAPYVIRLSMTNRDLGPRAWQFVVDRWDDINERFPTNTIARMLEGVRSLHEPAVADTVFAFFETHEVPQGDKILAQHLERLEINVALRRREADRLAEHLG
ncbi:MAG: M1 family metallopeptidase [Acidimicrobiales bacterium]